MRAMTRRVAVPTRWGSTWCASVLHSVLPRKRESRARGDAVRYPGLPLSRENGEPDQAMCRSEEHMSELQSLMRISYAVFCLKKKKKKLTTKQNIETEMSNMQTNTNKIVHEQESYQR